MQPYKNKKAEHNKSQQQPLKVKSHLKADESKMTANQKRNFWSGVCAVGVILFGVWTFKPSAVPDTDILTNDEKTTILNEYDAIASFQVDRISNPQELQQAIKSMSLRSDKQHILEKKIQEREIEMAWIQARDNMAEDGDVLKFESQNYQVTATLTNKPVIFALPLSPGANQVKVTGVHDGGGGITASVITSSGATSVPIINQGMSYTLPVK